MDTHLASAITGTRFAVVDVETTGLSTRWDRVLQVAVVEVQGDGTVLRSWSSYVRSPRWRRLGAADVHGLSRRDLRGAPPFPHVAPEIVSRLDGAVVVGHNVGFDWAFLRRALRRSGYRPPDAVRLCTLRLSRSLDPDRLLTHRLPDVAGRHGVVPTALHDALADATTTAAVLPHLLTATGAQRLDELRPLLRGTATAWDPHRRSRLRRLGQAVWPPAQPSPTVP